MENVVPGEPGEAPAPACGLARILKPSSPCGPRPLGPSGFPVGEPRWRPNEASFSTRRAQRPGAWIGGRLSCSSAVRTGACVRSELAHPAARLAGVPRLDRRPFPNTAQDRRARGGAAGATTANPAGGASAQRGQDRRELSGCAARSAIPLHDPLVSTSLLQLGAACLRQDAEAQGVRHSAAESGRFQQVAMPVLDMDRLSGYERRVLTTLDQRVEIVDVLPAAR